MGAVARSALAAGGEVIGVVPGGLAETEVAFKALDDLRVVGSMHERKALMAELADAFIALPGGLGTFEELLEALTWAQLRLHLKPCGLLNVDGYYTQLLAFLDHAVEEQFVQAVHRAMILVEEEPEALLARFEGYQPPQEDKVAWVSKMANG